MKNSRTRLLATNNVTPTTKSSSCGFEILQNVNSVVKWSIDSWPLALSSYDFDLVYLGMRVWILIVQKQALLTWSSIVNNLRVYNVFLKFVCYGTR